MLEALGVIADRTESLGQIPRAVQPARTLAAATAALDRRGATARAGGRVSIAGTASKCVREGGLEACVDEDQLEQALINLVKNALESQAARAAGRSW